jgi:tetratricopeptide (TPR) repeat protein
LLRGEAEVFGEKESNSSRKSHRRFRDPGIRGEEADSLLADSLLRLETARRDTALFRSVLDTITLKVQIDSSRLLKRLDSLRRERRETLLTLGEFYIYNMHLFDLADSLFAALDSSSMDDDQLMKRLYYRGELRVMQGDTTAGRVWFTQLIHRFPDSEAAKYLRKRLGLEEGKSREDYARELFAAAAVAWYDSLDYLSALEKYRRVTEEYHGTSLAPRAWLARIYLWNKVLENPQAARRDYEKLRSDYPDAPATEQASLWLGEVTQPRGPEEEKADREDSQLAEDQLLAPRIDESGRFIRPDEDAPLEVKLENFRNHVFSLGNIKVDRILK